MRIGLVLCSCELIIVVVHLNVLHGFIHYNVALDAGDGLPANGAAAAAQCSRAQPSLNACQAKCVPTIIWDGLQKHLKIKCQYKKFEINWWRVHTLSRTSLQMLHSKAALIFSTKGFSLNLAASFCFFNCSSRQVRQSSTPLSFLSLMQ